MMHLPRFVRKIVQMLDQGFFIWNVSPTIFKLGPIELRWYGLLFALGFYIGFRLIEKAYIWEKKPVEDVSPLLTTMVFSTLIGARLGHCLFYEPSYYLTHPWRIPMIWEGGLASHGAAIGVVIGLYLFSRKRKSITFLWICDRIAILATLAGGFIRLGNFMNSEIVGIPSQVPWAIIFLRIDQIPRHPAQLYEALFYFLIFISLGLLYFKTKLKDQSGFFMGAYFASTFIFRFFVEYVKEVQVSAEATLPLHLGQLLSFPFILFGIYMMFFYRRKTLKS